MHSTPISSVQNSFENPVSNNSFDELQIPEIDISHLLVPLYNVHSNQSISQNTVNLFNDESNSFRLTLYNKHIHDIATHPILPGCNCRLNCANKFNDIHREMIYNHFWNTNYEGQQRFFEAYIEEFEKKVSTSKLNSRRKYTQKYFLPSETGQKEVVCKTMFLSSLGLKSD